MFRGIENIFGQFWWVSLAAMTFILGWWMGRRVISKLVKQRGSYSSGELLAVPMIKRDSVALRKANSSAGITSMKMSAVASDRQPMTPEAARERDYQDQKNKLIAIQKDFDKVNANNLKLSADHAKLVVQLEAAEIKCKAMELETADQTALVTKLKADLDSVDRANSEKQVDTMTHKLNTLQSDLEALRQGRATVETKLKACEKERDDAREQLESESKKATDLSAAMASAEAAIAASNKRRDEDLQSALDHLEVERKRAQAFMDETEVVRKAGEVDGQARMKERDDAIAKLELEQNRSQALAVEVETLKHTLEAGPAAHEKDLDELRAELKLERDQVLKLSDELDALKLAAETESKARAKDVEDAHALLESERAKAQHLIAERDELKQQLELAKAAAEKPKDNYSDEELAALRAELTHEREHVHDITAEFEHYKKASITALEASDKEREEARAQLETEHAHVLELTAEIEEVNAAAKAIADSIPAAPPDQADEKAGPSAIQAELNAIMQSKKNLEALLVAKDAELAQTKTQWQLVMDQVEGIEAEKRRIHTQLNAREGLLNEIKTHHEDIKEKLHTAETALLRSRAELEELRARDSGNEETNSPGSPDDFHSIRGIGRTFEKRLYDNGVSTYADLASMTPEKLHELCRPPAHFKRPDYQNWIDQAQQMLEQ